jgi:hypothetical protein
MGDATTTVRDFVLANPRLSHVTVDSDLDLLRRLVRLIGHERLPAPRWSHVSQSLGHGSGVSSAICRALGFDPDEIVGDLVIETEDDEGSDHG